MTYEEMKRILIYCQILGFEGLNNGNSAIIPELAINLPKQNSFIGTQGNPAIFVSELTYKKLKQFHKDWIPNITIAISTTYLFNHQTSYIDIIGVLVHEAGHAFNVYAKIPNTETNAYVFEIETLMKLFKMSVLKRQFGITKEDVGAYFESRMAQYTLDTSNNLYLKILVNEITRFFELNSQRNKSELPIKTPVNPSFFKQVSNSENTGNYALKNADRSPYKLPIMEIDMYKWMKGIKLSDFVSPIDNFVNHLIDPASLAIPDDPVFVSYRDSQQLRLMSASSLKEMSKQMEESRQFIEEAPKDKSEIALTVRESITDKPYEKALKNILRSLVEKDMNRAEIRMFCNAVNLGLLQALNVAKENKELSASMINGIKKMVGEDKKHLVDAYLNTLNSLDNASEFKLLPQYFEDLRIQQMIELETQRKKLRDEKGDDLKSEEVICPLTRQIINIEYSLASQTDAAQFMMLITALARLANVNNSDLDEFIGNQDNNYVNQCFSLLQDYVQNQEQFSFSQTQIKQLNQLGMSTVMQQWEIQKALVQPEIDENAANRDKASPRLQEQRFRFYNTTQEMKEQRQQSIDYTASGYMHKSP